MPRIKERTTAETDLKRTPRQERGYQRVKQILDAAAQIVTEQGIGQLTVQNLSKEAQTSPGSLYHFFPDLDAVIQALTERHEGNINAIVQQQENSLTCEELCNGTADVFVRRLFSPYAEYLERNRDYLPVMQLRGFNFGESAFLGFIRTMLQFRYPAWQQEKVISEAFFLHAVATGVLQQAFQRETTLAYEFIPRILKVLELHLQSTEQDGER